MCPKRIIRVDRITVAASKEWTVSGLMHCQTELYTYRMHVCLGDVSEVGKRRTRAVFGLHRMEFMSLDNRFNLLFPLKIIRIIKLFSSSGGKMLGGRKEGIGTGNGHWRS